MAGGGDGASGTGQAGTVTDLCALDALALAGSLRSREVSAREVVAASIERVEAVDGLVNALVTRSAQRKWRRWSR